VRISNCRMPLMMLFVDLVVSAGMGDQGTGRASRIF
jgi:hypothetical protein